MEYLESTLIAAKSVYIGVQLLSDCKGTKWLEYAQSVNPIF